MKKLLFIAMLIVPWLTMPFLGRSALKRYLPAAIFMCTFVKAIDMYGKQKRWWRFYKGMPPFKSVDFLNLGPYFVTSLWMLKMTYGKFPLYLISNIVFQFLFTFLGLKYLKRYKIASLVRLTKFQYLAIDFLRALLLYGFQYICDLGHIKKT
ncbi:hypothetical protein EV207_1409 [Scopulibacillus darangshiensis]|uniref:Uncharacterized protein n=1 Tax=Scopulibacillus darangshiensis TaxID=442528 RepID=A0A4R2NJR0_9BACL|nr:hypothetical protein [Scopulibacillus darangshiensis]TCP21700.1 hypothetical protein EV207_1409 [Scopulibacillus darangshiensis]